MSTNTALKNEAPNGAPRQSLDSAVVRFAGDSGDGMQVTGGQFTLSAALAGNNLATFPDFPAEIRAPVGTTFGVSSFQINFGSSVIKTSGDDFDLLVAMNPAALFVELKGLKQGGIIVVDKGSFSDRNLRKAGYEENPLENGILDAYRLIQLDISQLTLDAVKEHGLSNKEALRCKNFWTLGYVYWMFAHKRKETIDFLRTKFAKRPDIAEANISALNAGHSLGETSEAADGFQGFAIPKSEDAAPGLYRTVMGSEAMAWGLTAGAQLANLHMTFCSYPITPASSVLHQLSNMSEYNLSTFQAEDEIAAVCAAIGASYAGNLGVTSSSGPGIALKGEAIGLAIGIEIPLVVLNTQRAGPSTGLPTKTEQSDLYQAVYGRNADSPLVVLAARSPAHCFEVAVEAVRLATKYMTPVMVLSDGYIGNAAEPWLIPDIDAIEPFPVTFRTDPEGFHPFVRDEETLARAWAIPGTPELMHRIGGIEKDYDSGHISYDPSNHQKMTDTRAAKIKGIANDVPAQTIHAGPDSGPVAVVGWGSTYGSINRAVSSLLDQGKQVSHIHLTNIWPLPANLGELLAGFDKVLVPEMNTGQLLTVLRSEYLVPAKGINKVNGQPFKIRELEQAIKAEMEG
ncbi:MAG: 2-oxoacid:acceptor oxidoreductase subunit alpha [Rhodospirillales bacterium]|jgi:2-oxoglutarate ferredoxin oxidoreductase subunit alpha|tara:strand:- start:171 stop:2051 length:1881 start_codon:yes stop_codon:yes gene_type:complete